MAKNTEYEFRNCTDKELREIGSLQGKAEDAKACCDHDSAEMYNDAIGGIYDRANKREIERVKAKKPRRIDQGIEL